MRVDPDQAIAQCFLEPRHDRHDHVQSHHADHNAKHGNDRDQRDEGFLSASSQISETNEKLVIHAGEIGSGGLALRTEQWK